jgi:hypothetical protein
MSENAECILQPDWIYAQIIFSAGFASHRVLNKDTTVLLKTFKSNYEFGKVIIHQTWALPDR